MRSGDLMPTSFFQTPIPACLFTLLLAMFKCRLVSQVQGEKIIFHQADLVGAFSRREKVVFGASESSIFSMFSMIQAITFQGLRPGRQLCSMLPLFSRH